MSGRVMVGIFGPRTIFFRLPVSAKRGYTISNLRALRRSRSR